MTKKIDEATRIQIETLRYLATLSALRRPDGFDTDEKAAIEAGARALEQMARGER